MQLRYVATPEHPYIAAPLSYPTLHTVNSQSNYVKAIADERPTSVQFWNECIWLHYKKNNYKETHTSPLLLQFLLSASYKSFFFICDR